MCGSGWSIEEVVQNTSSSGQDATDNASSSLADVGAGALGEGERFFRELDNFWLTEGRPFTQRTLPWALALPTGGKSLEWYAQWEQGEAAKENARRQKEYATKQAEIQRQQAEAQNVRNLRAAIRTSRAQAGVVANQAATGGVGGASGTLGAAGAISSGMAGELTYMNTMGGYATQMANLNVQQAHGNAEYANRVAQLQMYGAIARGVGDVAQSFGYGGYSGKGGFKSMTGG